MIFYHSWFYYCFFSSILFLFIQEYGIVEENSDDDTDTDNDDSETNPKENSDENTNYTESELNTFRKEVEHELKQADKSQKVSKLDSIQQYIQSVSGHIDLDNLPDKPQTLGVHTSITKLDKEDDAKSISSNDLDNEANDEVAQLDPNSRAYRMKMVEKILSDARSMRSYSTSASTIAPSVIKDKTKKSIELKEQRDIRKRCLAKGEANAVTRGRKENKSVVKEYAGWDF